MKGSNGHKPNTHIWMPLKGRVRHNDEINVVVVFSIAGVCVLSLELSLIFQPPPHYSKNPNIKIL